MISAVLLGIMAGLGLTGIVRAIIGSRPSLAQSVARLDGNRGPAGTFNITTPSGRAAARIAERVDDLPWYRRSLALDVQISNRRLDEIVGLWFKTAGMLAGLAVVASLAIGRDVSRSVPLGLVGVLLALGASTFSTVSSIRSGGKLGRERFRRSVSVYLFLLAQAMAGGSSLHEAMRGAAETTKSNDCRLILSACADGQRLNKSPWDGLEDLGHEWGMPDLVDIANTLRQAEASGSKVRETLFAKAQTMRHRELMELQSHAESAQSKMFIPSMVMFVGYLVMFLYPAVVGIKGLL